MCRLSPGPWAAMSKLDSAIWQEGDSLCHCHRLRPNLPPGSELSGSLLNDLPPFLLLRALALGCLGHRDRGHGQGQEAVGQLYGWTELRRICV